MPYFRTRPRLGRMKTTLILPDPLMAALKRRAAERGTSLSALAVELLRRGLDEKPREPYRANFPVFDAGPALLDLANKDELRDALSAEKDARLYGRPFSASTATAPAPEPEPPGR